ncbi:hypothetical protein HDV05_001484, partial [Chytridiales sp. JEL 0842]
AEGYQPHPDDPINGLVRSGDGVVTTIQAGKLYVNVNRNDNPTLPALEPQAFKQRSTEMGRGLCLTMKSLVEVMNANLFWSEILMYTYIATKADRFLQHNQMVNFDQEVAFVPLPALQEHANIDPAVPPNDWLNVDLRQNALHNFYSVVFEADRILAFLSPRVIRYMNLWGVQPGHAWYPHVNHPMLFHPDENNQFRQQVLQFIRPIIKLLRFGLLDMPAPNANQNRYPEAPPDGWLQGNGFRDAARDTPWQKWTLVGSKRGVYMSLIPALRYLILVIANRDPDNMST